MSENKANKDFVTATVRVPTELHSEVARKLVGSGESFQSVAVAAFERFARVEANFPARATLRPPSRPCRRAAPLRPRPRLSRSRGPATSIRWWNGGLVTDDREREAEMIGFVLGMLLIQQPPLQFEEHQVGEAIEKWEGFTHFFAEKMKACGAAVGRKARRCDELMDLRRGESTQVKTKDKLREVTWHFSQGLLTAMVVAMPPPGVEGAKFPDLDREAQLLVDVFGKPTGTFTEPYRNGYGAQFDAEGARWDRADGSVIVFRTGYFKGGQNLRSVKITFASAEAVADEERGRHSGPNPYRSGK